MSFANLITRFVDTPLMMHPPKLEVIIRAIGPRLGLEIDPASFKMEEDERTSRLMAHYQDNNDKNRSYALVDGVAMIPIQGTLSKRLRGMQAWSGGCSYMDVADQMNEAMSDSGVKAVMLDIDSPGGEVSGCFELVDHIYSLRGKKPIWGVANDCALSAGYAILSACDKIYVTRTGAVGSVGVYALHRDQVEANKANGLKYTYIFAGEHKVDGNPNEPLSDRAEANIQKEVNREYDMFVGAVSRNRGLSKKDVVATKADLFWAESACPNLADEVGTLDDAMAALLSTISKTTFTGRQAGSPAINPIKGEQTMLTAEEIAAKAKADDEEMKAKDKKAADDKKEKDDEDEDDMAKKAGAIAGTSLLLSAGRSDEDVLAISNLCSMAGVPNRSAEFIVKKSSKGVYMSVADVSSELMAGRVAEAERTGIMNGVDVLQGAGAKTNFDLLETQASSQVNRQMTHRQFGDGQRVGTTKQQAVAAALEANPEVYAAYRARHNAAGMIRQLQDAGLNLQFKS